MLWAVLLAIPFFVQTISMQAIVFCDTFFSAKRFTHYYRVVIVVPSSAATLAIICMLQCRLPYLIVLPRQPDSSRQSLARLIVIH